MTFGQRLKQEREARGIRIEEIAAATKIVSRYLKALEQDEFDDLPGDVFTKGYVRAIAEFIGCDPEALVEDYVRERGIRAPAAGEEADVAIVREMSRVLKSSSRSDARRKGTAPRRTGTFVLFAAGAIVLAAVVWIGVGLLRPGDKGSITPVRVARKQPSPPIDEPPTGPPPRPRQAEFDPAAIPPPVVEHEEPEPIAPPPPAQRIEPEPVAPPPPPPEVAKPAEPEPIVTPPPPSRTGPERAETPPPTPPPSAQEPDTELVYTPPQPSPNRDLVYTPPPPSPPPMSRLLVSEHGVGTGIVDHGLVGEAESFPEGTEVWFWNRVLRAERGDSIRHVWIHEGREVSSVVLDLGSGNWRTQSRKRLPFGALGGWSVEARDAPGRVLARKAFVCVSSGRQ